MANNKKNNKTCVICGKSYSYCPSCSVDSDKPSWYFVFDGENCNEIYNICTSYRDGVIDKKVAFEKINKCDISGLDNFADSTKKQIKEILMYSDVKEVKKVSQTPEQPAKKSNFIKKK